jgi:hypothetical protein
MALVWLGAMASLAVACIASCSSSKACGVDPGAATGGATCPALQGTTTFDEEVSSLCTFPQRYSGGQVLKGTKDCGGFLALYEQDGLDTESLYLFDPTTRELVETLDNSGGSLSYWTCTGVATTSGCTPASSAASCFSYNDPPDDPWGWDFKLACSATPDASAD